jgi:hypothetical protein
MSEKVEIPDELVDRLLGEYTGPEQLTGPGSGRRRSRSCYSATS